MKTRLQNSVNTKLVLRLVVKYLYAEIYWRRDAYQRGKSSLASCFPITSSLSGKSVFFDILSASKSINLTSIWLRRLGKTMQQEDWILTDVFIVSSRDSYIFGNKSATAREFIHTHTLNHSFRWLFFVFSGLNLSAQRKRQKGFRLKDLLEQSPSEILLTVLIREVLSTFRAF